MTLLLESNKTIITIIIISLISYIIYYYISNKKSNNVELDNKIQDLNNIIYKNPSLLSPYISRKNASTVIRKRYNEIYKDYLSIITKKGWKLLRTSNNISIETYDYNNDSWPIYIRTTSILNSNIIRIINAFRWENFDYTQKYIDPFYEKSSLLFEEADRWLNDVKDIKVIQKITKRPLFYPKREFYLGMLISKQSKDYIVRKSLGKTVQYAYDKLKTITKGDISNLNNNFYKISKNTVINALVNVNIAYDHNLKKTIKSQYKRAFQDFVVWFHDIGDNCTLLDIVMKVDMGNDIPRWAFITTVSTTGIWAMNSLNRLVSTDN